MEETLKSKASSMRWGILRRALLRPSSSDPEKQSSEIGIKHITRKAIQGFDLIPSHQIDDHFEEKTNVSSLISSRETCICYTLPIPNAPKLFLCQRVDNHADLNDFEICNKYNIDNTGLVCRWPSEEVLAYYCFSHAELFRSKKVIELGSGYGLAGLVIALATEALEVVISDGNPQVVDLNSLMLHWSQEDISDISNTFDVIVASDCTFFKEFHKGLAQTVKSLLRKEGPSEAIFFSPNRGDSLDNFLTEVKESDMHFCVEEIYDAEVWRLHQRFVNGDETWPNYDKDHCYPLLVRISI